MTSRPTAIERAFALAKSGRVTSISHIRHILRSEGYPEDGQFSGLVIRKQLIEAIKKAKGGER